MFTTLGKAALYSALARARLSPVSRVNSRHSSYKRCDMPVPDRPRFVALLQLLRRELADRLQHQEAWLTQVWNPADETLVRQLIEPIDHVAADILRRAAYRFDLFQAAAPGKNGESGEKAAAGGIDHVVAPLDCATKRLLTAWKVASPAAERTQRFLQPSQQRLRRKQFDARRRQLDRQRQTIHPLADAGYGGGIFVGGPEIRLDGNRPFDEQPHRLEL